MLHVQRPSMPSSLVSDHHPHNNPYQLPQLRDFDGGWNKSQTSRAGDNGLKSWSRGYTEQQLIPSPRIHLSSMNAHPPTASNSQDRLLSSISSIAQNAPPYPAPQNARPGHSRQNSKSRPFYQSYYSATKQQSPKPNKDNVAEREQSARRKASTDMNSIVTHLQIPPTINDSKGSLPEFAAQITCLFWFESSLTLQLVQDVRPLQMNVTPLCPEASPTMGFRKWVTTILSMTQVSQNVILLALMFIYRLKVLNPGVKGKVGSEFRLLTVALMLGNKFLDDNTYTNKTWADVSGISVQEIHVMEVEFLSNMRYSLYASKEEWDEWHKQLGKFSDYVEKASHASIEGPSHTLNPTNHPLGRATLPSPPTSQHTSPAFARIPQSSSTLLHPTTMAPFLPSTVASPASLPPPESDLRQWTRKRSLEDGHLEPPAKRLSSYTPSAPASTLPPNAFSDNSSPIPRLPMPNVTHSHHQGTLTASSSALPLPSTRAMSTVYPGTGKWPPNGVLPSLQPPQYSANAVSSNHGSPVNELPARSSPYGHISGTSSPTAYAFPAPHHPHTPVGLSPSGMPIPRNSPYKPIRGVNTLLVPPPSSSLHHAPQQFSFDQMHYQPLGKPVSERRTGILPYLPFDTWSQSHQMQHYLPQPQLPH